MISPIVNPKNNIFFRTIFFTAIILSTLSLWAHGEQITVKKVYTADKIKLSDGSKVLYIGLSIPNKKNKPFYEMCKKANIDMVLGKTVTIKTDVIKKQKDGKLLGYVFTGNFFVNAELIKEGYAMAHNVPPNSRYKNEFLSMQHEARKNRKGLWAFEDMSSEPYYVGSRTKNVFHRPNCSHANNIAFDDKVIFRTIDDALKKNFEQDWRCCPLFKEPVKKDEKDKTN